MNSSGKTISLVLSGGGARGLAQIGIIEQLTNHGYQINSIAGSSMGALIGGIYAMGKLDVYARWVTALARRDVINLLDFSFGGNGGLFKGERIIEVLKKLTGNVNIEDLPLKFTAIAADLDNEDEVWFEDGSLFDAIRASISVPTIFTPHRYRGRQYLDGCLVCPLPIAATLNDDTDLIIAVNQGGNLEHPVTEEKRVIGKKTNGDYQQLISQFIAGLKQHFEGKSNPTPGLFDIVVKSMNIVENRLAEEQLRAYSPDLVIEIPRDICNFYDFHRAKELIEFGRQQADKALTGLSNGR